MSYLRENVILAAVARDVFLGDSRNRVAGIALRMTPVAEH
jgi:hypothetical protein